MGRPKREDSKLLRMVRDHYRSWSRREGKTYGHLEKSTGISGSSIQSLLGCTDIKRKAKGSHIRPLELLIEAMGGDLSCIFHPDKTRGIAAASHPKDA